MYLQIQTDTDRHRQIQTDTDRHRQIQIDTDIDMELHAHMHLISGMRTCISRPPAVCMHRYKQM